MSKKNETYRHPDYIAIYWQTFKSPAWQALSVGARAVYVELAYWYHTRKENAVHVSARTGAKRLGVSKTTVVKWLRELQHYGFIVLVRGGSLGVKGYAIAQEFRLTDRPYAKSPPTFDFLNWTGELFEPPKHTMTEADKERRKRDRKKQKPVPAAGTPRTSGRDTEKAKPGEFPVYQRQGHRARTSGRDTATSQLPPEAEAVAASASEAPSTLATDQDELSIPKFLRRNLNGAGERKR